MDLRRISLIAGLAIVTYLLILQWSNDYSTVVPEAEVAALPTQTPSEESSSDIIPSGNVAETNTQPALVPSAEAQANTDRVSVRTDTFDLVIDLNGGDIVSAALPLYPFSIDTPDIPFSILESTGRIYTAQSGLAGVDGIDSSQERAQYVTDQARYVMSDDAEQLEVILSYQSSDEIAVNKVYLFTRGSYLIDVRFDITNRSATEKTMNMFGQLRRDRSSDPSGGGGIGMSSYLGATFSTESSSYNKVSFGKLEDDRFSESSVGGWVALLQHYFISAWVPNATDTNSFYGQQAGNGLFYVGYQSPGVTVEPGETKSIGGQLYVGPKDQDRLFDIASNLEKTVDYGWLWWIAQPLFKLMQFIHGIVGNWGWAIILMTLTVKIVLYPLTASSYRSMAKMRKFTPMIQELRDQYGDDRQRMSQEMMKLYQREKLNPLGGCLPMLIQMPVFIALYWVLMESVELRQSPFMFWIQDLSLKDPYFVLPLLMGASMFLQMQMQQQPTMDPMQQNIMKFMPVIFTFMFLWFPAGLTLYWFVNNVITIVQQYIVNKSVERAEAKAAAKKT